MISTSTSISSINSGLQRFAQAAARISDPTQSAGVDEIVQLKQAQADSEIGVAVLKKIIDAKRTVDVVA